MGKIVERISTILKDIEPNEFLASQAATCKIELVLRDYLHYKLFDNKNFFPKKEVTGYGKYPRASSDLMIFPRPSYEKGQKDVTIIELKQYYTDDCVYKKDAAIGVLRPLLEGDFEKYESDKNFVGIMFLVNFKSSQKDFDNFGEQFKYYHGFSKVRKKYGHDGEKIINDTKIELIKAMKAKYKEFKLNKLIESNLGTYRGLEMGLLSAIITRA